MMRPGIFKRTIFINKKFQFKIISYFLMITLGVLSVIWVAVLSSFAKFIEIGEKMGLTPGHPFFEFINGMKMELNITFAIVSFLSAILIIGIGAILSHRIAGPMYHLVKHLDETKMKKSNKALSFRKNDFFREICDSLNPILEELEEKRKERKDN